MARFAAVFMGLAGLFALFLGGAPLFAAAGGSPATIGLAFLTVAPIVGGGLALVGLALVVDDVARIRIVLELSYDQASGADAPPATRDPTRPRGHLDRVEAARIEREQRAQRAPPVFVDDHGLRGHR